MEVLIYSVINMGIKAVYFSGGGEPTIYPNIAGYVRKLYENGVEVSLLTNGSLLENAGLIEIANMFNYTARQQAPALYDMNASIYAYSPDFLRKNRSGILFDERCTFIKMPDTGVLDTDSGRDFLLMEVIALCLNMHDKNFHLVLKTAQKGNKS